MRPELRTWQVWCGCIQWHCLICLLEKVVEGAHPVHTPHPLSPNCRFHTVSLYALAQWQQIGSSQGRESQWQVPQEVPLLQPPARARLARWPGTYIPALHRHDGYIHASWPPLSVFIQPRLCCINKCRTQKRVQGRRRQSGSLDCVAWHSATTERWRGFIRQLTTRASDCR